MSTPGRSKEDSSLESTTPNNYKATNIHDTKSSEMKRAAAQKLIRRYFYQLTDGCGREECENEFCASSGKQKDLERNDAAALAIQCFQKRARLCETVASKKKLDNSHNHENHKVKAEVPHLTEDVLMTKIEKCRAGGSSYSPIVRLLGEVFSNSESLNKSFLYEDDEKRKNSLSRVDVESVQRIYKALFALGDSSIENTLLNSLSSLSTSLDIELRYKGLSESPDYMNQFVIVMENTMLQSPEYLDSALPAFLKAMAALPIKGQAYLCKFWSHKKPEHLRELVQTLQQLITYRVLTEPRGMCVNDDEAITNAVKCMKLFYYASILGGQFADCGDVMDCAYANGTNSRDPLEVELGIDTLDCVQAVLEYSEFINEPLNDAIDMEKDFTYYKSDSQQHKFAFLNYTFILSPATKNLGFFYDNRVRMYSERRMSFISSFLLLQGQGRQHSPYLRLKVRRDHLIEDALVRLEVITQDSPSDLKKQLYVEFDGEQGVDEGGVSKEFFQLIVEQIFNIDYGMFTYDEQHKVCWFNPTSFETEAQFSLIGIVLGLAIYNNIILDIQFPMVVYRKLFNKKVSYLDMKDSHPVLYKSLKELLEYEGDFENDLVLNFKISYTDVFGTVLTHVLKEGGEDLPVTAENRKEYVRLYADFILNKSIEKQFNAFRRGFDMVTDESPLKTFFRPEEVELLVCGSKEFDFDALEQSTEYDGGLTKDSQIIKWFWEIVHSFTHEQKKKLLMFTTGSDRVPFGGLAKLRFIIAKNGPDSDRLPTSHTCFNVLLLPDYNSREKLEERLLKAITHAKGFGLM